MQIVVRICAVQVPGGTEALHLGAMLLKENALRRLFRRRSSETPQSVSSLPTPSHKEMAVGNTTPSRLLQRRKSEDENLRLASLSLEERKEEVKDEDEFSPQSPPRSTSESKEDGEAVPLPHKGVFVRTFEEAKERGKLDPSWLCYGNQIMIRSEVPEWMTLTGDGFRGLSVKDEELRVAGGGVGQPHEVRPLLRLLLANTSLFFSF